MVVEAEAAVVLVEAVLRSMARSHSRLSCNYTCCLDGRVRLWDGRSGKCEREFQGFTKAVLDLDVAPDGRFALAGSDDGTARVFMATT